MDAETRSGTSDLTRREVFRIGVSAAALAAAAAVLAQAKPAAAGPTSTKATKGVQAANFRVRVAGIDLPGARTVEIGPIRTNFTLTPGRPPTLQFFGFVPTTTLKIEIAQSSSKPLFDWYESVKSGNDADVREVAIDLLTLNQKTVVRTIRAKRSILDGFRPPSVAGSEKSAPVEQYLLRCDVGAGAFAIEDVAPTPALTNGNGLAIRVADVGVSGGDFEGGWLSYKPGGVRFGPATGDDGADPAEFAVEHAECSRGVRSIDSPTSKFLAGLLNATQTTPVDVEIARRVGSALVGARVLYRTVILSEYSMGALDATSKDPLVERFEFVAKDLDVVAKSGD